MPFEPSFAPATDAFASQFGLTIDQLASIGAVVVTWSHLDMLQQDILCLLAESPLTLGQSLTEDLGPDNRLKALKRLCLTWESAIGDRHPEILEALTTVRLVTAWMENNKTMRNKVAHWIWLRMSDAEMVGWKFSAKPQHLYGASPADSRSMTIKSKDLFDLADQIKAQTTKLVHVVGALQVLPTWPKTQPSRDQTG